MTVGLHLLQARAREIAPGLPLSAVEPAARLELRTVRAPVTLRGELLIDDIQIDSKDRTVTPDQLGFQLGLSAPIPVGIPASIDVSYERVDSYTYLAQFYNQAWQHYNAPLGSEIGPDADLWQVGAEVFVAGPIRIAGQKHEPVAASKLSYSA